MLAPAITTTPTPIPMPATAALDNPVEAEPSELPAAASDEVALGADPKVEEAESDVVEEPVVTAEAEEEAEVEAEVVAGVVVVSVAAGDGDEVVEGVLAAAGVLEVDSVDGVGVGAAEEEGVGAPAGLYSGWPVDGILSLLLPHFQLHDSG
jgi:hypothetical protein